MICELVLESLEINVCTFEEAVGLTAYDEIAYLDVVHLYSQGKRK